MSEEQPTPETGDAAEAAVVEYLRANPAFFERHTELLESLRIPHPCRPAVSLIERQLALFREQNARLHHKLLDLVEVARSNDRVFERLQHLALGLIEASSLDDLLQVVKGVLRDEFNADFSALRLAARPVELNLLEEEEFAGAGALVLFEQQLRAGRPLCGQLSVAQLGCLFGHGASGVASAAVVPLSGHGWKGVLAVGSLDGERFQPAMGSLFLSRIGELVSQALQPHLLPLSSSESG